MDNDISPTVVGEQEEDTEFDILDIEYTDEEEKVLDQVFSALGEFNEKEDMDEIEPLGEIPEKEDFDE